VRASGIGFEAALMEMSAANLEEERWLERIASAFEHAGGGMLRAAFLAVYLVSAAQAADDARMLTRKLERMSAEERAAYLGSPEFRDWAAEHPEGAKRAMDAAADSGLIEMASDEYGDFLRDYWGGRAMSRAGIDPETWDPELGSAKNWDTVIKVYEYYGQLYLDDPDLQWAGMANLAGPSFAGAFKDLSVSGRISRALLDRRGSDIDPRVRSLLEPIAGLSAHELKFYEVSLLKMQKEIFLDLAWQHEAYRSGGREEIERLAATEALDAEAGDAWKQIGSGNPGAVLLGNRALLKREQLEIIDDDYDRMRTHLPSGPAVTRLITSIGQPSIPGAKSFPEVFPQKVVVETLGPQEIPLIGIDNPFQVQLTGRTGLPNGDISIAEHRWALINQDTLPAYRRLGQRNTKRLVASDLEQRIEAARPTRHLEDIAARLLGGEADVEVVQ